MEVMVFRAGPEGQDVLEGPGEVYCRDINISSEEMKEETTNHIRYAHRQPGTVGV